MLDRLEVYSADGVTLVVESRFAASEMREDQENIEQSQAGCPLDSCGNIPNIPAPARLLADRQR
jgi:hypothetical protein